MKYVINPKVISVHLANKVYTKEDKEVFDTESKKWEKHAISIVTACDAGFLVPLKEEKVEEKESKKEVVVEEKKETVEEKKEQPKPAQRRNVKPYKKGKK
jgi:hypothetical protein